MSQTNLIIAESLLKEGDLAGARELLAEVMADTEHREAARKLLAEIEATEKGVGSQLPLEVSVVERARQGAELGEGTEEEEAPSGEVVPPIDAGGSATPEKMAEEAQVETAVSTAGVEVVATGPDPAPPAPSGGEPSPAPSTVAPAVTESGELPDLSAHGAEIDRHLTAVSAALDHGDVAQALRKVEPVLRLFGDASLADEIVAAIGPEEPADPPDLTQVKRRRWLIAAVVLFVMLAAGLVLLSLGYFLRPADEASISEPGNIVETFEDAPSLDEESNGGVRPQEDRVADSTDPSGPFEELPIADVEAAPEQDEPRELAKGYLIVDASPWARVASIRRSDGTLAPPGDCRHTPCLLHLVAGTYRIELVHEELPPRTITATVAAERTLTAAVKLTGFSAEDFLVAATVE